MLTATDTIWTQFFFRWSEDTSENSQQRDLFPLHSFVFTSSIHFTQDSSADYLAGRLNCCLSSFCFESLFVSVCLLPAGKNLQVWGFSEVKICVRVWVPGPHSNNTESPSEQWGSWVRSPGTPQGSTDQIHTHTSIHTQNPGTHASQSTHYDLTQCSQPRATNRDTHTWTLLPVQPHRHLSIIQLEGDNEALRFRQRQR